MAQTSEISFEVAGTSSAQFHQVTEQGSRLERVNQTRGQVSGPGRFAYRNRQQQFQNRRSFRNNVQQGTEKTCNKCAKPIRLHRNGEYPAKYWKCHDCGNIGYVARACPNSDYRTGQFQEESDHKLGEYTKFNFHKICTEPPLYLYVNINGVDLKCEVDSGATTGVISSVIYQKYFLSSTLNKVSDKVFTLAEDSKCDVIGAIKVLLNKKFESQAIVV